MKLSFEGKSAVITGACGGMGIECVKKLNKAGLKILMLDIKNPPTNLLKKCNKAEFKKVDVTNFNKLKKIINEFYTRNKSIDYLINTTGVLWFDKDVSVTQIDFKVWVKSYDQIWEILSSPLLNEIMNQTQSSQER